MIREGRVGVEEDIEEIGAVIKGALYTSKSCRAWHKKLFLYLTVQVWMCTAHGSAVE